MYIHIFLPSQSEHLLGLPSFIFIRHLIYEFSHAVTSQIWNERAVSISYSKGLEPSIAKLAILWPPIHLQLRCSTLGSPDPVRAPLLHFWLPRSTSGSAAPLLALTIPSWLANPLSLFENCDGNLPNNSRPLLVFADLR